MSCDGCTESDLVAAPRLGLWGAMQTAISTGAFAFNLVAFLLNAEKPKWFELRNVSDYVHGYNDTFVAQLGANPFVSLLGDTTVENACWSELWSGATPSATLPPSPAMPPRALAQMTMYCNKRLLDHWDTFHANMLNGSTGGYFAPHMHNVNSFYNYVEVLQRSVEVAYAGEDSLGGVALRQYRLAESQMLAAALNPDNAAFRMDRTGFFPKPPVAGVGPEQVFLSFSKPYYLGANLTGAMLVQMPRPATPELDDTYQSIEPYTGVLGKVYNRLQLNVRMRPVAGVTALSAIPNTYVPVAALQEWMELPQSKVDELKARLFLPMHLGFGFGVALIVAGPLTAIAGLIYLWSRAKKSG